GGGHHAPGALVQALQRGEVIAQARPQVLGFAHIEHPAIRVAEPVDARPGGDLPRLGAIAQSGHAVSLERGAAHTRMPASISCRKRPVWLSSARASCSGVPVATTCPPPEPPSGPRSMIQSADLITSRLCSITITVLPLSASPLSTASSL